MAFEGTVRHDTLVEAELVAHVVRFLQLLLVLLGLNTQLLAHVLRREAPDLAVDLHVNDGDQLEGFHPLSLDSEVLPLPWLHQVHEGRVIVRGVAGDACDDPGALVHLDRQQGQQVHGVVLAGGRPHLRTHEVLTLDLQEALWLPPRRQDVLEAHVTGRPVRAHVHLLVPGFEAAVLPLRKDPAIGLARHGLRSQRSGEQEHAFPLEGLHHGGELEQLNLDGCVLLRSDALSLGPVVVHAGLPVHLAVDGRPLAEANLVRRLELPELPADKGVVVRVHGGRDEGAAEVDRCAEALQVPDAQRREVLQPMPRICERYHVLRLDTHGNENLPLEGGIARLCEDLLRDTLPAASPAAAALLVLGGRVDGHLVALLAVRAHRAVGQLSPDHVHAPTALHGRLAHHLALLLLQDVGARVRNVADLSELAALHAHEEVVGLDRFLPRRGGRLP
mmetsp:Transcript_123290/g.343315  ORF Transcript_123290/g.343315 Transcript_123290/m.343315 type:complete len:447 (-) Transcript_123290:609-1949(-)